MLFKVKTLVFERNLTSKMDLLKKQKSHPQSGKLFIGLTTKPALSGKTTQLF